jgi:hypothetical protein
MDKGIEWVGEASYIFVGNGQYQPYTRPISSACFAYSQLSDAISTTRAMVRKDHRPRKIVAYPIPATIMPADLALLYNGGNGFDSFETVVFINYGQYGIEMEVAAKFADAVQAAIAEVDGR